MEQTEYSVALGIGGNFPDTPAHLRMVPEYLRQGGLTRVRCSSWIVTPADNCVPGTPDFYNGAVIGDFRGTPRELLEVTKGIERRCGRPERHSSRESRIVDCDIILFGHRSYADERLIIPHPRAKERVFVMQVLNSLVPDWCFPDGRTVAYYWERLLATGVAPGIWADMRG